MASLIADMRDWLRANHGDYTESLTAEQVLDLIAGHYRPATGQPADLPTCCVGGITNFVADHAAGAVAERKARAS